MKIGERIKDIRTAKNLSQKEVALLLEMDQSQYSKIENGKTDPYFSTIEKISNALGVNLNDLLAPDDVFKNINSFEKSFIERLQLVDQLEDEEKKCIFSIIDSLVSKRRLKSALSNALNNS